jgi:Family of unknown function (DUF695)
MRLFKRGPEPPKDFWRWWATGSDRLAAALDAGTGGREMVSEISAAVHTIHPEMAWELAPGREARHAFCISPEGRADLRPIALRWLETAPPPNATWEFHASRQPSAKLGRLEVPGATVDFADVRAITSWDATRRKVDVHLWHSAFAQLPREGRLQVAFLFLDNLLGEDDVERWIGQIDLLEAPTDGKTPAELLAEVERHRTEPSADDSWVVGQIDGPDGPTIVSANAGLKRIDYPFAGIHVTVKVSIPGGGMPSGAEAERMNAEEDELVARFAAIGAYAGRTTRPGVRTMHFVAASVEDVKGVIDPWAKALPDLAESRPLKVGFQEDVNWRFRQRELGVA